MFYIQLYLIERNIRMAPKNKFTKKEMVNAAVQVVRKKGISALTAKALAEELGTSTQPIFTCFGTMDAAKAQVYIAAEQIFDSYTTAGLKEKIPFLGFGIEYLRFAKEESELYRLLFLTSPSNEKSDIMRTIAHSQQLVRPSLTQIYKINAADADRYFRDLWLVVHSLATLIVTNSCPYNDKEIEQILTGFSISVCKSIKEIPGFTANTFDRDKIFQDLIAHSDAK